MMPFILFFIMAKEPTDRVIVKYKKFESFNLNSLDVGGSNFVPGDFTVLERSRQNFQRTIPNRKSLKDRTIKDVMMIR